VNVHGAGRLGRRGRLDARAGQDRERGRYGAEVDFRGPQLTSVAPVKPLPLIATGVPPAPVPLDGLMLVMAGALGADTVKWSAEPVLDVPLGVVTVMSTVPAASAGAITVSDVSEVTSKTAAAVDPKDTAVAAVNPLPVTTIVSPPRVLPLLAEMADTTGTGELT
jgi:hypothetical protein